MVAEVRRLLSTCEVCQMAKVGGIQETQGRRRLYAGQPWQRIAIDLVEPIPITPLVNLWILVFTNHFIQWQDALPLLDATAPMVATTLEERVFYYFGIPEIIHSDQGDQYESALMDLLCQRRGCQKPHHSLLATSQCSSGAEQPHVGRRPVGFVAGEVPVRMGPTPPHVIRTMRATRHLAMREMANYLLLGRELRLSDELSGHVLPLSPDSTPRYAL